ncbi:MAG: FecR family protein [Acidobacteriia bacterium]|nr:FecR family protein [Terriglobia bacterium]
MKTRSPMLMLAAILTSLSIAVPPELGAQAGAKAGEIARAIPDVGIARGAQQLPAPVKALIDWGDVVRTGDGGRARVALDDGSVLNVGSSSSLTVTQHNAAAQQTQIELEYGRVRSQVVKQSKPNSKFEIHTSVGVAGVVGTDFFLGFENGLFQILVYEGTVKFCNLDGVCVTVGAGQTATIRDGHQPPDQPSQATPSELTEAAVATSVGATTAGGVPVHHIGTWWVVGLTLAIAVPAIVVPVATRGGSGSTVLKGGCNPNNPSAC